MGRLQATALQLLFLLALWISLADGDNGERTLSRRKRYVVFPEGSSFSIALCMTVHTLTPDKIFTEGLNWGISYDLPNESKPALEPFLELRKDPAKLNKYDQFHNNVNYFKHPANWNYDKKYYRPQVYSSNVNKKYYKPDYNYVRRRHRRDLYNKLEIIMNAMNFEGRTCILRALCEASQRLMPKGKTLVEEMMRIAFTLPLSRILSYEPEEHRTYTNAHRAGYEGRNCAAMFSSCGFSLIDMALGKYSSNDVTQDRTEETFNVPSHRRNSPVDTSQSDESFVGSFDASSEASKFVRYNMK